MGVSSNTNKLITEPTVVIKNGRRCTLYPFNGQALLLSEVAEQRDMKLSTLYDWVRSIGWQAAFAKPAPVSNQSSERPNGRMKSPDLDHLVEDPYFKNLLNSFIGMGLLGPRIEIVEQIQKRVRFQ